MGKQPLFWWPPGIYFSGQTVFLLLSTWHFVCHLEYWWEASDIFWWVRAALVTSWHLVGHPTSILLCTWSFGGSPVSLLVGMWH